MTPDETLTLLTIVASACPAMRMEETTPDVWHAILGHLDYADAEQAVIHLGRSQRWIAPSEVIAEVRTIREARLARAGNELANNPPPPDPIAWPARLRAQFAAVANRRDITPAITGPAPTRGCPPELRDLRAQQRVGAMSVTCPWCHAIPGELCVVPGTRQRLRDAGVHPARIEAFSRVSEAA